MEQTARERTTNNVAGELLTVRDVARRLSVSIASVYAVISEGKLACYRIGSGRGTIRVRGEDLDAYLAGCRVEGVEVETRVPRPRLKHLKL